MHFYRAIGYFAMGFTFLHSISSTSLAEPTRLERANSATEAFATLHFYEDSNGMHMSPNLVTYYKWATRNGSRSRTGYSQKLIASRWGLVFDDGRMAGLFAVKDRGVDVGVIGCVACHSGRAAGQYIIGLGNKNIDVVRMAGEVHRLETWWQKIVPKQRKSEAYLEVEKTALDFASYLGNPDIGNLTQGLVPVSFIRGWFYRVAGDPIPSDFSRGQVKVPHLWGYEQKRKAGQFCDGFGNGEVAGWAAAVELAAGQSPDVVRRYFPKVEAAELLFNDFLPPRYPFAVNRELAQHGQETFTKTCAKCHGEYHRDASGLPVFEQPKWIAWNIVQTDADRLAGNSPEFNARVKLGPLRDLMQLTDLGKGYFAPRLEGIWARFPYLHNGSVPSVRALLTIPADRPRAFSLRDSGERSRFDQNNLGLSQDQSPKQLAKLIKDRARDVYDVRRVGHSNQGHNFYTQLPDDEKSAIIEYLKTL